MIRCSLKQSIYISLAEKRRKPGRDNLFKRGPCLMKPSIKVFSFLQVQLCSLNYLNVNKTTESMGNL